MRNIGNVVLNSLDYILIVDKDYRIIYNTRYDEKINEDYGNLSRKDFVDKYFFDVYPELSKEESSVAKCIETEDVIVMRNQKYRDFVGNEYVTSNVTLPLRRKGKMVAAVELVMDIEPDNAEDSAGKDRNFEQFVKKVKETVGLITFESILTADEQMRENIEKAKIMATMPNPTLIYGETGTGKELFAQAIINYSHAPKDKVVIQNCAAVPENLIESILFGTVRGAYTGAENKKGLFEEADGGIIFLDELNSMPFHVQAKLLRVLQDGTFKPLGSNKDKKVSVKVIAAMNIDPLKAIEEKIIRKDLFYRFSSGLLTLPPLRERKKDIELFVNYYIEEFAEAYGKKINGIDSHLMDAFLAYEWEGNVRELSNTIESMVAQAPGMAVLNQDMLPRYVKTRILGSLSKACEAGHSLIDEMLEESEGIPYAEIMESVERELIEKALAMSDGNRSKAGEILGLPRQTLRYRIEKLNIGQQNTEQV